MRVQRSAVKRRRHSAEFKTKVALAARPRLVAHGRTSGGQVPVRPVILHQAQGGGRQGCRRSQPEARWREARPAMPAAGERRPPRRLACDPTEATAPTAGHHRLREAPHLPTPADNASSAESMSEFIGFGEVSWSVIQRKFHRLAGSEAIGSSGHHAKFVVEALDRAAGTLITVGPSAAKPRRNVACVPRRPTHSSRRQCVPSWSMTVRKSPARLPLPQGRGSLTTPCCGQRTRRGAPRNRVVMPHSGTNSHGRSGKRS